MNRRTLFAESLDFGRVLSGIRFILLEFEVFVLELQFDPFLHLG